MKFGRYAFVLLGILVGSGCNPQNQEAPSKENATSETSIASTTTTDSVQEADTKTRDWIPAWAITINPIKDYTLLLNKAHKLSLITGWPIDSLGRSYSAELDEIVETDSNSVRKGLYTPRREFGKWISLEQKEFFQTHGSGKAFPGTAGFVIVLSLHETQHEARQTLHWLKNTKSIHYAQIQAIQVYTGCLN